MVPVPVSPQRRSEKIVSGTFIPRHHVSGKWRSVQSENKCMRTLGAHHFQITRYKSVRSKTIYYKFYLHAADISNNHTKSNLKFRNILLMNVINVNVVKLVKSITLDRTNCLSVSEFILAFKA